MTTEISPRRRAIRVAKYAAAVTLAAAGGVPFIAIMLYGLALWVVLAWRLITG